LASFFAYDQSFSGGVRVAAVDVNGDGKADIVTGAGPGGGPHVKAFDGTNPGNVLESFFAFDPGFLGGVFVG
jgi:serralysin